MKQAAAITFLAATPAFADGTATWLWDVTTQDGDAIVESGETASITLTLLMEPSGNEGVALSATIFDVLGGIGADQGAVIDWEYHNSLGDLTGDLATTDGVNIYSVNAGQLTAQTQPFTLDNPVDVFTFEWQPFNYAPLDVAYDTNSYANNEHQIFVWEWAFGDNYHDAHPIGYPVAEAAIQFTVIPTPPTILLFTIFTFPRRRRP